MRGLPGDVLPATSLGGAREEAEGQTVRCNVFGDTIHTYVLSVPSAEGMVGR